MTATERLPTFTPTDEYAVYRVTVGHDLYDEDAGRSTVEVDAIGPTSARQLALEQFRDEAQPFVLRVDLVCVGCPHVMADHGPTGCTHRFYNERVVIPCGCKAVRG